LEKPELCEDCNGRGGEDYEKCNECNGQGIKKVTQRTPFGVFASTITCKKCQGHGEIIKNTCQTCKGRGVVHKRKTLEVSIPAGVDSGAQLRLREEGEAVKNGTTGDLYIFINVETHKYFAREGDDILLDVPITITQAILGDEIEVPTLEDKAMLKIPKGTQPETILRMKGKGVEHLNRHGVGDELITIKVEIPEKLTRKQEELIKEFDKESGKRKSFFDKLFK
jgi:molecular chaperone DnaJ